MERLEDLKFLVDVGVSKKVEDWLRNQGYDVKCVRDMDPRMPDMEIMNCFCVYRDGKLRVRRQTY